MAYQATMVEKRLYFIVQWSLVFVFLLIAITPIPASLTTWIQSQASNWQNISYLRLTFLLAGIGIALQTYIHQYHEKYDANSLTHDVLMTVLIVYVSIAIVLLWKYLAGAMPELGTGQNIFLYTVFSESTADLFSKANMFHPPFLMPMYGPLYFGTARWLMNVTGQSILAFRVMTVVAVLVICLALKGIASKYAGGYLAWVAPAVFLAVFPLVVWSGPPTNPTRAALIAQSYGDPNAEDKIIDQIRALDLKGDQYILSDLEYTYAVYRAGKRPLLLDSFYYTLLVENGLINPATLYDYLKKEKVPYLVLHLPPDAYAALPYGYRGFPPELLTYFEQHYRCETKMKRWDGTLFVLCSQIPSTT